MINHLDSDHACEADIVILGGGIAGLWLLNHLSAIGYSALLLEADSLGNGQSIASQGIIHGGLKYALDGTLSGAANAIAGMPARWRRCLAGDDPVNLSGCRLLSQHYFMWSGGNLRSRLKTFLGSKALRGRIEPVDDEKYPAWLAPSKGQGSLYRLEDFVIDTGSLLRTLCEPVNDRVLGFDRDSLSFDRDGQRDICSVRVTTAGGILKIDAQRVILAAGAGNAELMKRAGLNEPSMQRRPLNMVTVKGADLPSAFVHCIGDSFSMTPVLTVTSHACKDGCNAWYLGGALAEDGVGIGDDEQIDRASKCLSELFPWLDQSALKFACLRIDRAEGQDAGRHRPDTAFLACQGKLMVAWPTKFTLSPSLADEVVTVLEKQGVKPVCRTGLVELDRFVARPGYARPPWEIAFAAT